MRKKSRPDWDGLLTAAERREAGHAVRARVSRGAHAGWAPQAGRRPPMELLRANDAGRIACLLPLRYSRMRADAFAFFRGAACIMAADLASLPDTGLVVQACGDAHIANFGAFASPEGKPFFDVNDFDETAPAPFEWDVKRLVASLAVAARVQGLPDKAARALARRAAHAYRRHIHDLACLPPLDAWGWRIRLDDAIEEIGDREVRRRQRQSLHHAIAASRTAYGALVGTGTRLRLREDPPALFRLGEHEPVAHGAFRQYVDRLPAERRMLVDRYRLQDVAFKAVGVGSVGTFCAIGLFATAEGDPLLLQLKEAGRSVIAAGGPTPLQPGAPGHAGQRVVVGQRIMQATPDMFLGWTEAEGRMFYVRHLKDPRLAAVGQGIEAGALGFYARLCGRTLARAHGRGGDAAGIAGYLGDGDAFDAALADFAIAYADQTEKDFRGFKAAVDDQGHPVHEVLAA